MTEFKKSGYVWMVLAVIGTLVIYFAIENTINSKIFTLTFEIISLSIPIIIAGIKKWF